MSKKKESKFPALELLFEEVNLDVLNNKIDFKLKSGSIEGFTLTFSDIDKLISELQAIKGTNEL